MKLRILTIALAATALSALAANAQTTIIEQRQPAIVVAPAPPRAVVVAPAPPPAAVVVEEPAPAQSVTVERNNLGLLGNQTTTTVNTVGAGVDCHRQTTTTNTLLGSSTSSQQACN